MFLERMCPMAEDIIASVDGELCAHAVPGTRLTPTQVSLILLGRQITGRWSLPYDLIYSLCVSLFSFQGAGQANNVLGSAQRRSTKNGLIHPSSAFLHSRTTTSSCG